MVRCLRLYKNITLHEMTIQMTGFAPIGNAYINSRCMHICWVIYEYY